MCVHMCITVKKQSSKFCALHIWHVEVHKQLNTKMYRLKGVFLLLSRTEWHGFKHMSLICTSK
uniref:Uncharacterized protein n=1 Tax=Anguilla anguilla TaxID=7936 RepID=A0A0E9XIA0_ANGAN